MIEEQKEKCGWEFLFIGANIDAVETAARFGIKRDRAVNYNADSVGTGVLYDTVAATVCSFRKHASVQANWAKNIHKDFELRKREK